MRRFTLPFVLFAIPMCSLLVAGIEVSRETPAQIENPLIGTWKLVSAKHHGRESDLAERYTIHKHVTPTHSIWVHVDPNTQEIVRCIGGTYSFIEGKLTAKALYGYGNWYPSNRNRTNTLSCRVEDGKWYHAGRLANGAMIEEVWERVSLASGNEIPREDPAQTENPIIGTWKFVRAKHYGRESDLAERYTIHKHVTPTHSIWVHVDPNTQEIVRCIGGTYSFTEKTVTTKTLYGYGNWYPSNRNRTNTLSCRVEDGKWYHAGRLANGAMIEEVWEYIEGEAPVDVAVEPVATHHEEPIIEVRVYKVAEGKMDEWERFFHDRLVEPQEKAGIKILTAYRTLGDENLFVWSRQFSSKANMAKERAAFYQSDSWKKNLLPELKEKGFVEKVEIVYTVRPSQGAAIN